MELHENLTERGFLPALKDRVSTAHPRMSTGRFGTEIGQRIAEALDDSIEGTGLERAATLLYHMAPDLQIQLGIDEILLPSNRFLNVRNETLTLDEVFAGANPHKTVVVTVLALVNSLLGGESYLVDVRALTLATKNPALHVRPVAAQSPLVGLA